jgi:5-methylcytosine-specific restriction endonuclease McrA
MRDFAREFYSSKRWAACREAYRAHVGHLCERCLKKGLIVPGAIVHHKVYLTPENINDPAITTGLDNLVSLCRECHKRRHKPEPERYKVDEYGRVIIRD